MNNPQAFPSQNKNSRVLPGGAILEHFERGMSLRDWFAGQALVGLCTLQGYGDEDEWYADAAYKIADAMLKEREGECPTCHDGTRMVAHAIAGQPNSEQWYSNCPKCGRPLRIPEEG